MNVQEQLQQVRDRLAQLDPNNRDHLGEISNLKTKEAELMTSIDHEERVQAQEEIIASIVLPHDFNDLFDNAAANDIITEVVQQFQRQAYQEHNAEIVLLETSYKDKLRAADDREAQLQRQNDDLQKQSQALSDEIADLKRSELEALAQAAEANRGRDLLAQELDVKSAEIANLLERVNDMQKQLAAAQQPQKQTEIQGTDRLDNLIQQIQEDKALKAQKALESFYARHADLAPPELKQPEPPEDKELQFRTYTPADSQDSGISAAETTQNVGEQFQTAHDAVQSSAAVDQSAGQDDSGTISREEFTALVGRVERLEAQANMMGAA